MQPKQSSVILVRNVPIETSHDELLAYFSQSDLNIIKLKEVSPKGKQRIVKNLNITYSTPEEARQAIEFFHKAKIHNNVISAFPLTIVNIKNLPRNITKVRLSDEMSKYGSVSFIDFSSRKRKKTSTAVVSFREMFDTNNIIEQLNNITVLGSKLRVYFQTSQI